MNKPPGPLKSKTAIRAALERSWSKSTSLCYNPSVAPVSYGQCAQTAIVVFELLGGKILRTEVGKLRGGSIRHFYNEIIGERLDFTADQFSIPGYWCDLSYQDIPSSVEEARTELLDGQLEAMRSAFRLAMETSGVA